MPAMLLAAFAPLGQTLFGALFVVMGIFVILSFVRARRVARSVLGWPTTIGTITRAWLEERRVNKGAVRYAVNVEYTYQVYGRTFTGTRIRFRGTPLLTQSAANAALAEKYRVGEQVGVYYDPNDLEQAVLDRNPGSTWAAPVVACVFIVIGALIMGGLGSSPK